MTSELDKNTPLGFFIIDYSTGGGVERVTANLMQQFYDKGYQNLFLISLNSASPQPVMKYPEVKRLKILSSYKKKFSAELSHFLKENQIKHLIFQGDNMTIALQVLKATECSETKAYPQYHGSAYAYLKKYSDAEHSNIHKKVFANIVYPFKRNKLKKFISQSKQGLYCVSEGAANELKLIFKNDDEIKNKINVVRNPILIPTEKHLNKKQHIVFASRLEARHKNAFLAVKTWAKIAHQFPDWKLIVLGDGSLKEKMMAYSNKHAVKNIEFKGFVNHVDEEFAESLVSLNVSNCEGFSMSVAEAIAKKNAIVSTDSDGGISDMLIHNDTALISPKNNAKNLSKNLEKVLSNSHLREQLAENAFRNLMKISETNTAEIWLEILAR